MLDSYDGDEHTKSPRNRINIVSYSTQMFSSSTVSAGILPTKSVNILTWQQVLGEEKSANIFPSLGSVFDMKQSFLEGAET